MRARPPSHTRAHDHKRSLLCCTQLCPRPVPAPGATPLLPLPCLCPRRLPLLKALDGAPVHQERASSSNAEADVLVALTPQMIQEHAFTSRRCAPSLHRARAR